MSNRLRFCRRGLVFGVACGLGLIAFAGQITSRGSSRSTSPKLVLCHPLP